ncbi:MAG: ribonuclease III [Kiritimatiellae bacterium]|nr:ribonuclease III [Kiritimatiellia bacterium]MDW8458230.1 ribonuclease III [Verrucomicrobiota bacterium]
MILRPNPYKELEAAIGYRFRKRRHLEEALTHPSFAHENPGVDIRHNQRLEFLGDAALGLIAAHSLYSLKPDASEGELTKLRSALSSTRALADIAQSIRLGDYLRLGRGEEMGGGRLRASILADALEAVIGAAFLDGGLKAAIKIFQAVFAPRLDLATTLEWYENPKGALQEWTHKQGTAAPEYRVKHEEGPPHQRRFTVEVSVGGRPLGEGSGRTKREAEKDAARDALRRIRGPMGGDVLRS